jgi:hypothetical protein
MHRGAFIAVTGIQPSKAENQAIWDRFRAIKDLTAGASGYSIE